MPGPATVYRLLYENSVFTYVVSLLWHCQCSFKSDKNAIKLPGNASFGNLFTTEKAVKIVVLHANFMLKKLPWLSSPVIILQPQLLTLSNAVCTAVLLASYCVCKVIFDVLLRRPILDTHT